MLTRSNPPVPVSRVLGLAECAILPLKLLLFSLYTAIGSSRHFPASFPHLLTSATLGLRPGDPAPIPTHCCLSHSRLPCRALTLLPHSQSEIPHDLPPQSSKARVRASRPSAQAPECAAPSRQRASHVTASQSGSAWSLASVYFPPFSPNMESSRNKKGPFPHYGEGRGNFKSGL